MDETNASSTSISMTAMNETVVLKVGTSSLIDSNTHQVRLSALGRVVEMCLELQRQGYKVVLVSSGAVGVGCVRLGVRERPKAIAQLQALAAIGQVHLMQLYDHAFTTLGGRCAQVLLTYDNFGQHEQYQNAKQTFEALLQMGVVPIVNENDTIAVQELRVGDNDTLGALVASLAQAHWLFLLTDVDALYSSDPTTNSNAQPLRVVPAHEIATLRRLCALDLPLLLSTQERKNSVDGQEKGSFNEVRFARPPEEGEDNPKTHTGSGEWGTGGMQTKLHAAQLASASGITTFVMSSSHASLLSVPHLLQDVETQQRQAPIGTRFLPHPKPAKGRKRWLLALAPMGSLFLDAGAIRAVVHGKKSLFAVGIRAIEGNFNTNDVVRLLDDKKIEVARALVNYNADDCQKLIGAKSEDIPSILGYISSDTIALRDNIVVLDGLTE